jgi:hypothetical protein
VLLLLLLQNKSRIDIGRLRRLSGAFGNYTVSGLTQANGAAALPAVGQPAALPPALDDTTRDALRMVFSARGNIAQARPLAAPPLTWLLVGPARDQLL